MNKKIDKALRRRWKPHHLYEHKTIHIEGELVKEQVKIADVDNGRIIREIVMSWLKNDKKWKVQSQSLNKPWSYSFEECAEDDLLSIAEELYSELLDYEEEIGLENGL